MGVPLASIGKFLAVVFSLYVVHRLHLFWQRYRLSSREGCRPCPKYPQRDPIFGLDTLWETIQGFKDGHYLELLIKRHNQYGRTFSFNQFSETTISTCDPGVMKCVLSTHFKDFSTGDLRSNSLTPLLGQGILTIDGEQWRHQRALIRPSFNRAQVTDLSTFEHHATDLIQAIMRNGCDVDAHDLVQKMVLDANIEYLFGEPIGLLEEQASESAQILNESIDCALEGVIYRLRLGKLMFLHRDPKFREACRTIHSFADRYVAKALELRKREKAGLKSDEPEKYILLNEMAKDTDDPILLRDEIVTMIAAARDTTSATISFALYLLARRPDIWAKLRADVVAHYVTPLTYEAISEMKYLAHVVTEVLRMFPPIANNGRMAIRDTVLPVGGGVDGTAPLLVTKGTSVIFSAYVMHRRDELWGPSAYEFQPERWSADSEKGGRHGWEYLPFLGGPRICPGQKFALTEISHVLARLAFTFKEIQNLDPNEWREQWTLSIAPKDGVKVRFVPADK